LLVALQYSSAYAKNFSKGDNIFLFCLIGRKKDIRNMSTKGFPQRDYKAFIGDKNELLQD